jgi:hypothetical protein
MQIQANTSGSDDNLFTNKIMAIAPTPVPAPVNNNIKAIAPIPANQKSNPILFNPAIPNTDAIPTIFAFPNEYSVGITNLMVQNVTSGRMT